MEKEIVYKTDAAVYSAEHVRKVLGLGKTKTYDYLQEVYDNQAPFRVIKIGKLFRIPKKPFDEWLYGHSDTP